MRKPWGDMDKQDAAFSKSVMKIRKKQKDKKQVTDICEAENREREAQRNAM